MKKRLWLVVALVAAAAPLMAQTAFFEVKLENIAPAYDLQGSGVFNTPVGEANPAPIGPGASYAFDVYANPGASLSFATMFIPSNDLFLAPGPDGIPLWNEDGSPVEGDVTNQVQIWDAGTEENQEPGVGPDQAQRQSGANSGAADADNSVRPVSDGFTYPEVAAIVKVMVSTTGPNRFSISIENVSTATTLQPSDNSMQAVPLAPGIWVVHTESAPLFTQGEPDRGLGLEDIAEDGNPAVLAGELATLSGVTQILSPGVRVVHYDPAPLFAAGEADRDLGLASIAEDGNPGGLASVLAGDTTNTGSAFLIPGGADGPAPIGPGGSYTFVVSARPGSFLSVASMLVQSNDLFLAPDEAGIALFDADDNPVDADVSSALRIWDVGTEVNQAPGFGPDQAPRQAGPNTGEDEGGLVRLVDDGFVYPDPENIARLTVRPLETMPFEIRIENVSSSSTLTPSDGTMQAVPLTPGVWVVHTDPAPLFSDGLADRGRGLEHIAEDGNPANLGSATAARPGFDSGVFSVPVGATEASAIGPGGAYSFQVDAAPGARLSFATMFVPSNDVFLAPSETGISLFDGDGNPIVGDITDQLSLWDAGTEENQEPGVGPDQPQRQSAANTGETDPDATVRSVSDGFAYPLVADVIRVSIQPVATSTEASRAVPDRFSLFANYPNPFNPSTSISFALDDAAHVTLNVYDALGRSVTRLVDGRLAAGTHSVSFNTASRGLSDLPSGIYVYRLEVDGVGTARKMTLLR